MARSSQAWFFYNLNTEILSYTDSVLQYLHIIKCPVNPPLASCCPMFTYLENQPSCSWWRIPIYSWPWSGDNCPTPYQFSHPFTPNPQIKLQLQCLHRQHQQYQLSSSGTVISGPDLCKIIRNSFRAPVVLQSKNMNIILEGKATCRLWDSNRVGWQALSRCLLSLVRLSPNRFFGCHTKFYDDDLLLFPSKIILKLGYSKQTIIFKSFTEYPPGRGGGVRSK